MGCVIIDSNVWISALVFGGMPRRVFEKVASEGYRLVVSAELLTETRRIIASKFPEFAQDLEDSLVALSTRIVTVQLGKSPVRASRDAADDFKSEMAFAESAEYIVSGDKDLLVLGRYQTVVIIRPSEIIAING